MIDDEEQRNTIVFRKEIEYGEICVNVRYNWLWGYVAKLV